MDEIAALDDKLAGFSHNVESLADKLRAVKDLMSGYLLTQEFQDVQYYKTVFNELVKSGVAQGCYRDNVEFSVKVGKSLMEKIPAFVVTGLVMSYVVRAGGMLTAPAARDVRNRDGVHTDVEDYVGGQFVRHGPFSRKEYKELLEGFLETLPEYRLLCIERKAAVFSDFAKEFEGRVCVYDEPKSLCGYLVHELEAALEKV